MEQVMETVREAGGRVLDALCETGKAILGFGAGVVKSVSCAMAGAVKDCTCKAAGCTWDKVKQTVFFHKIRIGKSADTTDRKIGVLSYLITEF